MSSPLTLQNFIPLSTHVKIPSDVGKIHTHEYETTQGNEQDANQDQNMDTNQAFEEIVKQIATPKINNLDTRNLSDESVNKKFNFKGRENETLDTFNSSAQVAAGDISGLKNFSDNIVDTKNILQNTQDLKSSYAALKNQIDIAAQMTIDKDTFVIPQQMTSHDTTGKTQEIKDITEIKQNVQKEKNLNSLYDSTQNQAITNTIILDKNPWEKMQAFPSLANQKPITLDANSILPCLNEDLKIIFQPLEKLDSAGKTIEMQSNKTLLKQKIPVLQKQVHHQSNSHQADGLAFAKSSSFNAKHAISFQFQIPYDKSDNQNSSSDNTSDNQETKKSQTSTAAPKQQNSFSFGLSSPNLGEVMVRIKKVSNDYKLTFLCSKNSTAITLGKNIAVLDNQLSSKGIAVSSFGIVGVESDCMRQVGIYNASMNFVMSKKYIKTK